MIEDLRNTADLIKKQSEAIPQIINLQFGSGFDGLGFSLAIHGLIFTFNQTAVL